jgi:hypothetical protein
MRSKVFYVPVRLNVGGSCGIEYGVVYSVWVKFLLLSVVTKQELTCAAMDMRCERDQKTPRLCLLKMTVRLRTYEFL